MIVMSDMANDTRKNVKRALSLMDHYDEHNYTRTVELESTLNKYEDKLGNYLVGWCEFRTKQNNQQIATSH